MLTAIDGSVGLKTLAGEEGDFRVLLMAPSISAARRVNLFSVPCTALLRSLSARAGRLLCTPLTFSAHLRAASREK